MGVVVEGACLLVVLIGRLGRRVAGFFLVDFRSLASTFATHASAARFACVIFLEILQLIGLG